MREAKYASRRTYRNLVSHALPVDEYVNERQEYKDLEMCLADNNRDWRKCRHIVKEWKRCDMEAKRDLEKARAGGKKRGPR